jgi:L-threonylcarbamoyladenylate synthase
VTPEQIEMVIGVYPEIAAHSAADDSPRVSGSLDAHYAPTTPMRLVAGGRLLDFLNAIRHSGRRCGALCHSQPPHAGMPHAWRMLPADPEGYARGIYAVLRELDGAGVDMIVVEDVPQNPAWAAVADRLRRAACGAGAA